MLNKNEEYTGITESFGYNGEGIVKVDGIPVFLPYAIKGERVRFKIVKVKQGYAYGKLLAVEEPSPMRREPVCPVFYKCGGCAMQHIDYKSQLAVKAETVRDCFKKIAGMDIDVPPAEPGGEYRYRNKVQLPVRNTPNGVQIGFFRENSHDIVPIDDCPIQKEWVKELIAAFRAYVTKGRIPCYDESTGRGCLKHIVARQVGDKLMIVAVAADKNLPHINLLTDELDARFSGYSLFVNENRLANNVILGKSFRLVKGEKFAVTKDNGIVSSMGPESFMQVNDEVKTKIYTDAVRLAGESRAVVDAYSGAGYLTALLAAGASAVHGVECVEEAVSVARKLALENGIDNVRFTCGRCEDVLPALIPELKEEYGAITVVLDPPRKGCDRAVLSVLRDVKPDKILYISCNPATLARDVGIITGKLVYDGNNLVSAPQGDGNYEVDYIKPYDMFPQTRHVETVCRLVLKQR